MVYLFKFYQVIFILLRVFDQLHLFRYSGLPAAVIQTINIVQKFTWINFVKSEYQWFIEFKIKDKKKRDTCFSPSIHLFFYCTFTGHYSSCGTKYMTFKKPNILIVDNYDSFTFNLVQIIREYGKCDFNVEKSDKLNISDAGIYDGILFSPGPGIPAEVPVMAELLKVYGEKKSFLGVCLGYQAIAETFGMKLVKLNNVRHGVKAWIRIIEPADYVFKGIPIEFEAGLYHSWGIYFDCNNQHPDSNLRVTALSNDGIIMGIAHIKFNIRGFQFHPESFMSECGPLIVQNWINNLRVSSAMNGT